VSGYPCFVLLLFALPAVVAAGTASLSYCCSKRRSNWSERAGASDNPSPFSKPRNTSRFQTRSEPAATTVLLLLLLMTPLCNLLIIIYLFIYHLSLTHWHVSSFWLASFCRKFFLFFDCQSPYATATPACRPNPLRRATRAVLPRRRVTFRKPMGMTHRLMIFCCRPSPRKVRRSAPPALVRLRLVPNAQSTVMRHPRNRKTVWPAILLRAAIVDLLPNRQATNHGTTNHGTTTISLLLLRASAAMRHGTTRR